MESSQTDQCARPVTSCGYFHKASHLSVSNDAPKQWGNSKYQRARSNLIVSLRRCHWLLPTSLEDSRKWNVSEESMCTDSIVLSPTGICTGPNHTKLFQWMKWPQSPSMLVFGMKRSYPIGSVYVTGLFSEVDHHILCIEEILYAVRSLVRPVPGRLVLRLCVCQPLVDGLLRSPPTRLRPSYSK